MSLSLTELRQRLFKLADEVIDTGVPLVIERRGVRLRLIREDAQPSPGRLSKLKAQALVNGIALAPDESAASWSELAQVAEKATDYTAVPPPATRKR